MVLRKVINGDGKTRAGRLGMRVVFASIVGLFCQGDRQVVFASIVGLFCHYTKSHHGGEAPPCVCASCVCVTVDYCNWARHQQNVGSWSKSGCVHSWLLSQVRWGARERSLACLKKHILPQVHEG